METEAAGVLKEVDVEKAKTLRLTEVGWKQTSCNTFEYQMLCIPSV